MPIITKALEEANISTSVTTHLNQVLSNVTGTPYTLPLDPTEVRARLAEQVTAPVQWYASLQWCQANGIQTFVELGPGNTLVNLVKQSIYQKKDGPHAKVHSLGTAPGMTEFLRAVL